MTGKEAIAMLKRMQEPEAWEPQINEAAFEALELAIKALEGKDTNACANCQEFDCYGCKHKLDTQTNDMYDY